MTEIDHITGLPSIISNAEHRHMPYPLTDLQQAYWIGQTDLIELGNMFAHVYMEFDFIQLDLARLTWVCQYLIKRHDVLRSIVLADGQQQVLPTTPPYQIAINDLQKHDEGEVLTQLLIIREHMSQHGPSTYEWPLWDIRASLLDQQRTRLHVSFCLLLLDARSVANLIKEGMQLYQDPDVLLPSLMLTYRDYVLSLHEMKHSDLYEESLAYWQQRLTSLPPSPELPLARHPNEVQVLRFVSHTARLDHATWQYLQAIAVRQELISPIAVIYTAYTEVLAAWSKNAHFTINLLFANRFPLHPQVNDLVGNLSTTLLLEVNHGETAGFLIRAKRLQKQLLDDLAHSYVNGVQVIREVAKIQGWTSKALMPVAFTSSVGIDAMPMQGKGMFLGSGEQGKLAYHSIQTPLVYLDHQIYEDQDGLLIKWDMVDELFPVGVPEQMLTTYCQLLQRLAYDEDVWHQEHYCLVPVAQLARYAVVNTTDVSLPPELLLQTLASQQAVQCSAQPAVITPTRTLSYGEVQQIAIHISHWLREAGARPNQLVGIIMEKGWEQVVGTLGVLYAGAAYLPLDPALPQERMKYLLKHGAVQQVLTQSWIDERLVWPVSIQRLCIDDDHLAALPTQLLDSVQRPEDLAYVIYTSGSTGVPKGVMIEHRSAVNTLLDINQRFHIAYEDRVLALSSLSFDLSVYDLFGLLAVGGAVVLPATEALQDPAHWAQLLKQEQVTVWNTVPALMEMLIEYLKQQGERLPSTLRLVLLSGDWIPVQLPSKIKSLGSETIQVVSLGGATEASIWSILYPIEESDPHWASIPYGRPMTNQHVYVLDIDLEQRATWVPGQIYIGGVGLARGYWHDESRTAASFIVHPRTGERLYYTGDLGRYLPDGTIEFLGREDLQVKIQGYRIELGEIEAVLRQYPGVREAIVIVEQTEQGGKRLVAYVLPEQEQYLDTNELRTFARSKLPGYMVPSLISTIETVPLTANGKVDRKALSAHSTSQETRSAQRNSVVGQLDEVEQQLVELWETILEQHPINVDDNFFDLGGNSLAALRLMGQIRQQFGQQLALSLLFERATITQLANALHWPAIESQAHQSPLVAIQPNGSNPAFFWVHPVGGNVLCYVELSRQLGEEQPVYGLQAVGLEQEEIPLSTVEEMATGYLQAMQKVQPRGPYMIGGWSMGGIVAYEMAQQLHQEGEEVRLVVLLDSDVPISLAEGAEVPDDAELLAWFAQDLGESSGKRLKISAEDIGKLHVGEERLKWLLQQTKQAQMLPAETEVLYLSRLVEVFKANAQALRGYVPQASTLSTVLVASEETIMHYAGDETLGWGKLLNNVFEVYIMQGNHYSMMGQPYVQQLAECLKRCINESEKPLP